MATTDAPSKLCPTLQYSCKLCVAEAEKQHQATKPAPKQRLFQSLSDLYSHLVNAHWGENRDKLLPGAKQFNDRSLDIAERHLQACLRNRQELKDYLDWEMNANTEEGLSKEAAVCKPPLFYLKDARIDVEDSSSSDVASSIAMHNSEEWRSRTVVYDDFHFAVLWKPQGEETIAFKHNPVVLDVGRPWRLFRPKEERKLKKQEKKQAKKQAMKISSQGEAMENDVAMPPAKIPKTGTSEMAASALDRLLHHESLGNAEFPLEYDPLGAPEPVHRLDKATGGLLLFAKTKISQTSLCALFREDTEEIMTNANIKETQLETKSHSTDDKEDNMDNIEQCIDNADFAKRIQKRYRAILVGQLQPNSNVFLQSLPSDRCASSGLKVYEALGSRAFRLTYPVNSKFARTRIEILEYYRLQQRDGEVFDFTRVDLYPETGRYHQLRRHAELMGHSILGDTAHNGEVDGLEIELGVSDTAQSLPQDGKEQRAITLQRDRLHLFACGLRFVHPFTGQLVEIQADPPGL